MRVLQWVLWAILGGAILAALVALTGCNDSDLVADGATTSRSICYRIQQDMGGQCTTWVVADFHYGYRANRISFSNGMGNITLGGTYRITPIQCPNMEARK